MPHRNEQLTLFELTASDDFEPPRGIAAGHASSSVIPKSDPSTPEGNISSRDTGTDTEVDLASYAYQIWKNAVDADPKLAKVVADLPDVVFSTKPHSPTAGRRAGLYSHRRG